MITLVLHLLRLLPFLCAGQRQLALENLALRQQLAVYKRTVPRPRLRTMDRLVWVGLARVWAGWKQALVIVSPDTVLILCPADEEMLYPAVRKRWQEEMAGRGERGGPSPSMRGLVDQRTNTFRAPGGSIADCPGRQENGAEGSRESRPPEGRYKANLAVHTSPGRARPRLSGRRH
jgi:hypothetical protein